MLNQNRNLRTKALKTIFVTIHLALISLGLVSCVQAPNPPEKTSPQQEQGNQQPGEADKDDEDDDKEDGKDDDKDDDRN